MTPFGYRDRLRRLDHRCEVLWKDLQNNPQQHLRMMQLAWQEARALVPNPGLDFVVQSKESSAAARAVSMLDAILCLLERIARPSTWLDEQTPWFNRARHSLLDAVEHVARVRDEPRLLPPLLALEPIASPLYYPRAAGSGSWVSLAASADLPLPVIVCPGSMLEEPWEWATLLHEVGHHLDASRKETQQLTVQLFAAESQRQLTLGPWPGWIQEAIADLYAGLLGGPGAIETLSAAFARNPYGSGNHPPGETRSEVLQTAWRSVRDGTPVQGNEPNQVVAGLLAAHFAAWQPHVQADEALMTHGPLPPRLVAGSLRRDADGGAQPDALRNKCEALFKEFPLPDWSLTEARLLTLRSAMRHLVETRLSSGPEPWKLPPVELLVRHDVISFVGATHGQLLESLKKARQQRGERPWTRIELYALADAPLRRLTLGQKSGQALFEERDASLRELRSYLSQHKIAHQQYLYDDSYLVVSYWDAEDNEARPRGGAPAHIHVSSHLWGLDLRRAPAHDYEAPAGEPLPPQMRQYVDALRQLRKLSSEI